MDTPIALLGCNQPVLKVAKANGLAVKPKVGGRQGVSHRWYFVLSLHLSGYTYAEISELSGYSPSYISIILSDEKILSLRQLMMKDIDREFEALYSQVVSEIRDCLYNEDPKIRLDAVDKWFKVHGKYKNTTSQVNVTAEDVVVQILNQAKDTG